MKVYKSFIPAKELSLAERQQLGLPVELYTSAVFLEMDVEDLDDPTKMHSALIKACKEARL